MRNILGLILFIAFFTGCESSVVTQENQPTDDQENRLKTTSSDSLPDWATGVDLKTVDVRLEVERVEKVLDDARDKFITRFNQATQAERAEMREQMPQPQPYVDHVQRLIDARASDEQIAAAYVFIATRGRLRGDRREKMLTTIFTRFPKSKELNKLYYQLLNGRLGPAYDERLQVMVNSPHRDVRGLGLLATAEYLKQVLDAQPHIDKIKANPQMLAYVGDVEYAANKKIEPTEIEALYQNVADNYAEVLLLDKPLGDWAKTALFELKFLSIGQVAPDIKGQDLDGVEFSLSDYRGKVVMLDFWGHW